MKNRVVEMKVPAFFTDLYKVMNFCFEKCSTRNGAIPYPSFIMRLYDDLMEGDFGCAESLTYLCCLWVNLIDRGIVPEESFEVIDDTCIKFGEMSDEIFNEVSKLVEKLGVEGRVRFVHETAQGIESSF